MKIKENKLLRVIIFVIMIMAIMIQTSIASTTGVITYDTVRVRKDPEPDLKKTKTYALVSIGDKVEVLEKSGDWYKITCTYEGKQVTGYVREDLIDVKNPELLKDTGKDKEDSSSNNSNNSSNSNSNNNNNSNSNNTNNNSNSNGNSTNTEEPDEKDNNNSSSTTEKPSESNPDNSNEQPLEDEKNNQTEQPTNTNEPIHNQSETQLTTVKVEQAQKQEGKKINLTKDVNIKILPVVNSTNIGTITAGTEATVVEVVNQWIRIETEELIGWARIES